MLIINNYCDNGDYHFIQGDGYSDYYPYGDGCALGYGNGNGWGDGDRGYGNTKGDGNGCDMTISMKKGIVIEKAMEWRRLQRRWQE